MTDLFSQPAHPSDPDALPLAEYAERAYLDALTHRLNLPQPLVAQLDAQVAAAG